MSNYKPLVNGGKRTEYGIEKLIEKKRQLLETYYLYTWWDFCNIDGNIELKQQQKLICSNFLWIWENIIGLLKGKLRKIRYPIPRARLLQIAQKAICHTLTLQPQELFLSKETLGTEPLPIVRRMAYILLGEYGAYL